MLKYVNTAVVFAEIPDETTLAINISGCPCRCPGCHSTYLWKDIGSPLDADAIDSLLLGKETDITCIAFMGGDASPTDVCHLADYIHKAYPQLHIAWYSGRIRIERSVDKSLFQYIKTGPYIKHLGPLNVSTTNQRLYKQQDDGTFKDITSRLWEKEMT